MNNLMVDMYDNREVMVDKQVLVSFSIGKYKDEVMCDVVPMKAGTSC